MPSVKRSAPVRWRLRDVRIHVGLLGDKTDPAYELAKGYVTSRVPGLAVTPGVGSYVGQWAVTHMATGYKIREHQPTLEGGRSQLLALADLADWTQSGDAILAIKGLRQRVDKALAPPKRKTKSR